MLSKKALIAFAIPFSVSSAFAMVQIIPQAKLDLKAIAETKTLVLKSAKGTLLQKSVMDVAPENWFNLSPVDGAEGVRTEETYVTFSQPESEDIIVAVIDSGVDVNHEDQIGRAHV